MTEDVPEIGELLEEYSDLMLYMIKEMIERKKIEKNLDKTRGWVMIQKESKS